LVRTLGKIGKKEGETGEKDDEGRRQARGDDYT
jgi:hypothetical protein